MKTVAYVALAAWIVALVAVGLGYLATKVIEIEGETK